MIKLENLLACGDRERTIADRRHLVLGEKELCQIPNSNSVVVASRRVDLPVFEPAGRGGEHGAFVGNPATDFLESRIEFLTVSVGHIP